MAYIEPRKTSTGKTSYRVMVRLKGFPTQSATFERKTDAKKWAQQTEAAIREGRYFTSTESKKHTLKELVERYEKDILPRLKSGHDRKQHLKWWKNELGAYLLSDIRPALIIETRDRLGSEVIGKGNEGKDKKRTLATVNRYLSTLSHMFSIAVKEYGWMDNNPLFKISKMKESRGRVRFLSDKERKALLKACQPHKQLYTIVVIALSTGARKNEIMRLTWDDVNLQKGLIVLHETKNGEIRTLPLQGHAQELVKEMQEARNVATPLLFPSRKNPRKPIDIQKPWEEALEAAKIGDFRFHDLRHSAASYLAMNGASLAEIAEVLGHKTLQMVKRYAHLSEAHTSKVVAAMNERIFG